MRRKIVAILVIVLLLSLSAVAVVTAQTTPQTTPPTLQLSPGSASASGTLDPTFVQPSQTWVAVVACPNSIGTSTGPGDSRCEVLGEATVNPDGSWNVSLSRPVDFGECAEIWFSFNNKATWELWFGCADTGPLLIPEPATLALLGLGAAGLAGYVRRRRRHGEK